MATSEAIQWRISTEVPPPVPDPKREADLYFGADAGLHLKPWSNTKTWGFITIDVPDLPPDLDEAMSIAVERAIPVVEAALARLREIAGGAS